MNSYIPFSGSEVNDIAHAIQLSLAPVFLLSGIGVLLTMLTNRLARVVDRARPMEERLAQAEKASDPVLGADMKDRLKVLARRARLLNRAIALSTLSALATAIVVQLVFASAFVHFSLATPVALLFIFAMIALAAALVAFLIEVQVATRALRIGPWH